MLQSFPPAREVHIPNLKEIDLAISEIRVSKISNYFSFLCLFAHFAKNAIIRIANPIALKFGTHKGSPKANSTIKFRANPMKGSGFMTDYSCKTRAIFFKERRTGPIVGTPIHHTLFYAKMFYKISLADLLSRLQGKPLMDFFYNNNDTASVYKRYCN